MVHTRLVFTSLLSVLAYASTFAGTCENAQACSSYCPAAGTCNSSDECGPDGVCIPYPDWPLCSPSFCHCEGGSWTCTDNCAGICSFDWDGDGITGLYDNCPTVFNPSQSNCDHDALGDACDACPCDPESDADGDGICGDYDNCRYVNNVSQQDADADGLGDACDCSPFDAEEGTPLDVSGLHVSGTLFQWTPTARADSYDVARASLLDRVFVCWTAHDGNPADTQFVDTEVPLAGDGWGYLVRGVDTACGAGPWGGWASSSVCP